MMDDKMCQCGHYESDHGADGSCCSSASTGYCPCFIFDDSGAPPDPRDAEIARLKAQIDEDNRVILAVRKHNRQLRAALAAGPAALREGRRRCAEYIDAAEIVEAAQEAAMKEGT